MDNAIIGNINKTVKSQNNLYLLGDVSWYNGEKTYELLKQINCKNLFLIVGNHDRWTKDSKCKKLLQGIYDLNGIEDKGRIVILCHYPMAVWDQSHRGSYHLYGHHNIGENGEITHKILAHEELTNSFNVGCMHSYMGYTPRTLDWIISKNKYSKNKC